MIAHLVELKLGEYDKLEVFVLCIACNIRFLEHIFGRD